MSSPRKRCKACGRRLAASSFYAQPRNADGRAGTCKECHKARVRAAYAANRERRSAYEAARRADPARRAAAVEYQRRARQRHPERARARWMLWDAVRRGALVPQPCKCGARRVQAHHEDYTRPLDVTWACFRCHREAHGQVVVNEGNTRTFLARETPIAFSLTPEQEEAISEAALAGGGVHDGRTCGCTPCRRARQALLIPDPGPPN